MRRWSIYAISMCNYCVSAQTQSDDDDENVGAIVGGVFGGLAVIIIAIVVFKLWSG